MKVLVVDDDPSSRYLLESILRSGGHDVMSAQNGADALAQAKVTPPDLLITDILMPQVDGYQLARSWKADTQLSGIPLVFYTASYTDPADERFASTLGADAFWRKPMDARALLERVAEFAQRQGASASPARQPELADEAEILQEYSQRLVHKLEQKAVELERANAELRSAMEVLAEEVSVKASLIDQLNADVIERKRVEAELRRERDFTQQVIDVADIFICVLDEDYRIVLFSRGAEEMTGFSSAEMTGRPYVDVLVRPDFRERFSTALSLLGEKGAWHVQLPVLTKAGAVRFLDLTVSPTSGEGGEVVAVNIFGIDVTQARLLEELRTGFVANVSHELRTPLTAILGFTDVLSQMSSLQLAERGPDVIGKIRQSGERMKRLVEELLEVNTIQSEGSLPMAVRAVDLEQVVLEHAEIVPRTPDHRLVVEADPDIPEVRCDPERIGRVVENLVSNAVKYSPKGGPIHVYVGLDGTFASISVTDHGVGIAPEDLPRLFDRFTQGDMATRREFGGMGNGLFVADAIVRAHGGRIDVNSAKSRGTTFTVRIPIGA
ncbi:MAG: ATP-binding protein [Coriobacteriales bacterium]